MTDRKDEERKTPSWQLPKERQPETDAYHIWTPRPLLRSVYWKPDPPPPDDSAPPAYEIFLDQRAWTTMHEHVWQADVENTPFGYLIGDLCEDPNAGRRFVSITAALPARFNFDESEREQISREATLALQLEVERRRGVLAGWYHRHLGGAVELTEQDVSTHLHHFREPWQFALLFVGGGDRSEGGCFRVAADEPDGRQPVPFYEMASNESLLARGVKRSYLDWSNYTTVDEIRAEPRPRPRLEILAPTAPDPTPPADRVDAGSAPESEGEQELESGGEADGRGSEEELASSGELTKAQDEVATSDDEIGSGEHPASAEDLAPEDEGVSEAVAEPEEEAEPAPPSIQEAPRTEEGELDFDAIIDEVKAARIEFDESEADVAASGEDVEASAVEVDASTEEAAPDENAESELEADGPDWMPEAKSAEAGKEVPPSTAGFTPQPEPAPAGAGTTEAPATVTVPATPSVQTGPGSGEPDRARLIGLVLIGLVLLAAIAWGLVTVLGDDAEPVDTGIVETVRGDATEAEGGTEETGPGGTPPVVEDSVPPVPAVTAAAVDSAGRDMLATISRFYGLAVARDNGNATCADLETAFVAVENAWIRYNNDFKGRFEEDLPEDLATRDERLYAGIQDAEVEYERSGCPRP